MKFYFALLKFVFTFSLRLEGPSLPSVIQPSEAINPKTSNSPRAIELIKRKVPVPRDPLDLTNTLSNESDLHGNMVMGRERSQSRLSNLSANSTNRYHHNEISSHFKHLSILSSTEISSTAALSTKYVFWWITVYQFTFLFWRKRIIQKSVILKLCFYLNDCMCGKCVVIE